MTIREFLRRRYRIVAMLELTSLVLFGVGAILAYHLHGSFGLLAVLGLLIFISVGVYVRFLLKCPRCGNRIGFLLKGTFGLISKIDTEVSCCPFCRSDLDSDSADIDENHRNSRYAPRGGS